ncbi:23S rRNA (adenine(2503)-C2)-methyltransferase, partial [Candidatus Peregrinibacteria bacterium]|nr:23S rRNA (adenine(2503)-C2)-methyltransferase [Candidatus Peregrinibacteria bacterium]
RRWKIDDLLDAINYYTEKTHRRVSFEYVMLNGINDQPETAEKLAEVSGGKLKHINLIPYNATDIAGISGSAKDNIIKFKNILQKKGISVTVRVTMGQDIAAACGQLANKNKANND